MAPIELCRYHYDPLDRLASVAPSSEADLLRFYQKNRLATQIQGALQRSVFHHDDQLLAQQQRSGSAVDTTLLATDQQSSVLQVLASEQREGLSYTAYGHQPAESGLSSLLGFNGEQRDPLTGHYILGSGYRAFNPVLMRFNSPDSFSPFGDGGLNVYAYCQGDPVNWQDPTGHMREPHLGYPVQKVVKVVQPSAASGSNRSRSQSPDVGMQVASQSSSPKTPGEVTRPSTPASTITSAEVPVSTAPVLQVAGPAPVRRGNQRQQAPRQAGSRTRNYAPRAQRLKISESGIVDAKQAQSVAEYYRRGTVKLNARTMSSEARDVLSGRLAKIRQQLYAYYFRQRADTGKYNFYDDYLIKFGPENPPD